MLYVLTIGWQWFAGAFALGLAAGFLLAPSGRTAENSGGRTATAAALALLGGVGLAAASQSAPGRDGLTLDIAYLAGFAYFAGFPAGSFGRSLAAAPAPARAPVAGLPGETAIAEERPEPSIAAPPAFEAPQPAAEISAAPAETAAAPLAIAEPAPPAPALESAAAAVLEPAAKAASRPRKAPPAGARPDGIAAPRGGAPDDLTRIKGLGPKSAEKLHELGIFHIDQVAAWNLENARWISAAIGGPGRVERGKWIQQAREIAAAAKAR